MSKKMLIDAGHHEETRVVVADGSKVEEFDFEAAAKRPIRGNIYLAKVTRVEPSLQAAFVEYGGNRHGFLAFNEIHPDYYQIPYEDRVALAEEEASAVAEDDDDAEEAPASDAAAETSEDADSADAPVEADADSDEADADSNGEAEAIDNAADDVEDDIDDQKAARMRRQLYRKYKIQEVIKRRQVLLVQVAKEERGNKGAALTTYLSLAGRYCVLMPNTPRGGGISRKISNAADRKRLKSVVSELDLPKGVGLIIRTAGAKRTKTEIRRDADYLLRLWSNIREATLQSVAPTLIYEEGNLVKRAIRDLYDKEIDEVLVEGEAAYKEAKAFMRMLMPSHAKKVQHYKEPVPLFLRHGCENQLEAIYSPIAPLKSGGYLVINPTEALVSIDVNSGRATRERNIEATALKTNLEAAAEAARQMRLRDLAGLVVIDFIDMDEAKNNRAVEKRMKDVLKRDRARLQMGRISQFGLMEISRQRRRTSLIEGSTTECPHCGGTGHLRSSESSALVALRGLEQEGTRGRSKRVRISVPTAVALYLLNEKRDHVLDIEQRFQMRVIVAADDDLIAPALRIEPLESREPGQELQIAPLSVESVDEIETPEPSADGEEEREGSGRRRRRRRRRRGKGEDNAEASVETSAEDSSVDEDSGDRSDAAGDDDEDGAPRRRRRRGRRGGRGRRRGENANAEEAVSDDAEAEAGTPAEADEAAPAEGDDAPAETSEEAPAEEKPKRKRRSRRKPSADAETAEAAAETVAETDTTSETPAEPAAEAEAETAEAEDKPKRRTRRPRKTKAEKEAEAAEAGTAEAPAETTEAEEKPKKRTRRKKAEEPAAETAAEESTEAATEKPKPKRSRKRKDAEAEAPAEAAAEVAPEPAAEAEPQPEPAAASEAESADTDEPSKPKRRGWWNRTGLFGN
ncbi:ribonuclease E/G [Maricaulis sp.]|uniref:Rne/Rng family ribonuclease n=1 Tax=Maricaulis sp. TaxID=1486257 RepID=UPI0026032006|nr:ribonuclease E/G [Maricaulis sp.]